MWISALTSCEWFLKVLVLTHSFSCCPMVEGRNWNWTTVPSEVPAITLLSSWAQSQSFNIPTSHDLLVFVLKRSPETRPEPEHPIWWPGESWSEFPSLRPRSGPSPPSLHWRRFCQRGRGRSTPPPLGFYTFPLLCPPAACVWHSLGEQTVNVKGQDGPNLTPYLHVTHISFFIL